MSAPHPGALAAAGDALRHARYLSCSYSDEALAELAITTYWDHLPQRANARVDRRRRDRSPRPIPAVEGAPPASSDILPDG